MMKVVVKQPDDPKRLSTLAKVGIITVSVFIILYVFLISFRTNISEAYFTDSFIYRSNPSDEFLIVRKNKFNWNIFLLILG